jgi:hypothetical protein
MSGNQVARWLALILGLFSIPGMADPENPFLTPGHPTAEDTIVVNAHAGPCDGLQLGFLVPEVSINGNHITVQLTGVHHTDPVDCVFGSRVDQVEIGSFPPGSYTITINWQYFNLIEWVQVTLGELPLTIRGGAPSDEPVASPASGGVGLTLLALMLAATVALRLGASRHGRPLFDQLRIWCGDNSFGKR